MTSQVALLNHHAVAIASDTIATNENGRALHSEKLIPLPKPHRVAIAIRGPIRLMGADVVVLIHVWANQLQAPLPCLDDYADSFRRWLVQNADQEFPIDENDRVIDLVREFLIDIESVGSKAWKDFDDLDWDGDIDKQSSDLWDRVITERVGLWESSKVRDKIPTAKAIENARSVLNTQFQELIARYFEKHSISNESLQTLDKMLEIVLTRDLPFDNETGLFFIGFGSEDRFPRTMDVVISGVVLGESIGTMSGKEANDEHYESRIVVPAQGSAIQGFLRGMEIEYLEILENAIGSAMITVTSDSNGLSHVTDLIDHESVAKEIWIHVKETINERVRKNYVDKVLDVIALYTHEGLAAMAESLVGIQSLRSEANEDRPTVGGSIEVLTITRHEGCKWVKKRLQV